MPTEKTKRKTKLVPKKANQKALVSNPAVASLRRVKGLLSRRPHRSFRRTLRRDYVRSLKLPGYWAFTSYVAGILWRNKRLFFSLALTYTVLSGVLVGIGSQDTYTQLSNVFTQASGDIFDGEWGQIGKATLVLTTLLSGTLNGTMTDIQWLYSGITALLAWLTTVWLLRAIVAGHTPKLRDGLYNGGSPIIATFLVGMVVLIQLLPLAIALIGLSVATRTGILDNNVLSMLIGIIALLLTVLSLYWATSTMLALVVVTLPGMYPLRAIKTAGDLVIGRRMRILLRLLWLGLTTVVLWVVLMIPIILLDAWLKSMLHQVEWLPLVPFALLAVSSFMVVWTASYVYLLYRKVVDDDTSPA